ncbi:mapk-regulated corepressor-interacting protein 1 isoform X1 [Emydura macquarii macquarii]|uniref:mapk-regulated corepressor-interacting protein 1 isoform X1 n=1 Tax=Emydura macquarii macquarii TaxID=1129001 RepID=UPI00352A7C74
MTSSPVSRVVYNGKRNSSPRSPSNSSEIFTPAHEENVRFIYEAWQCVERDLRNQMGSERGLVEEYVEKMPNPSLKGCQSAQAALDTALVYPPLVSHWSAVQAWRAGEWLRGHPASEGMAGWALHCWWRFCGDRLNSAMEAQLRTKASSLYLKT